jgi:hypothetical protein
MSGSWFFVVVRPDSVPEMVGAAGADVHAAMTQLVGGAVHCAAVLRPHIVVWCAVDAEAQQLPITRTIDGRPLRGKLLVTGRPDERNESSADSVPRESYRAVMRLFTEHPTTITREDIEGSFTVEASFFARVTSWFGL